MMFKSVFCKTTNLLYVAAAGCSSYLAISWIILLIFDGRRTADNFAVFFLTDYGGLLTGIPIYSLYLISERFLNQVPIAISRCVSYRELRSTNYRENRKNYSSYTKAIAQSSSYFLMSYAIFLLLRFDKGTHEDIILNVYSSLEVYAVCFVARKLYHIGRMLESIRDVDVDEDLFADDKLSKIVITVNIFTFFMILSLIIYTIIHYKLSYVCDFLSPNALKPLVVMPVLLIFPVLLLFNFQPRAVVNSLYRRSIEKRRTRLSELINRSDLDDVEKQKQLIDYEKFLKDELRYHYRLIFTEAPVVLTIVFSLLTIFIRMI